MSGRSIIIHRNWVSHIVHSFPCDYLWHILCVSLLLWWHVIHEIWRAWITSDTLVLYNSLYCGTASQTCTILSWRGCRLSFHNNFTWRWLETPFVTINYITIILNLFNYISVCILVPIFSSFHLLCKQVKSVLSMELCIPCHAWFVFSMTSV